jgi:signal transduction histidine kinase
MRVDGVSPDTKEVLSRIGSVSRELTDAMSDIVWSVNPQRDHLADLVQRMRRFSSDVLGNGGIEFHFHAPSPGQPMRIASEVRREVYLIFKESVNNAARHSHCTCVDITIFIDHRQLILTVNDNGRGLCQRDGHAGNGLRNIKERANRIGAHLEVNSGKAGGLKITLRVPIDGSRLPEQVGRSIANPPILESAHETDIADGEFKGGDH